MSKYDVIVVGAGIAGLVTTTEIAGFGGGAIHGYRSLEGMFLGSLSTM